MLKPAFAAARLAGALFATTALADVTVYTAGPTEPDRQAVGQGFTKQTGIKVNVFQATTGKVMARIEAEAANPIVDVADFGVVGHGSRHGQARLAGCLHQPERGQGSGLS